MEEMNETANQPIVKKPFTCHICESNFARKRDMSNHIKSVHEGIQFNCDLCDAKFTFNRNLQRHIASVHEKKKLFSCEKCDATFTNKHNMKLHIGSIHEGKHFNCHLCAAKFTLNCNFL